VNKPALACTGCLTWSAMLDMRGAFMRARACCGGFVLFVLFLALCLVFAIFLGPLPASILRCSAMAGLKPHKSERQGWISCGSGHLLSAAPAAALTQLCTPSGHVCSSAVGSAAASSSGCSMLAVMVAV
jgi:hypothetical protein